MLPRLGGGRLIDTWIFVTLGASLLAFASGGWLARWATLVPAEVWRGEIWRLVTWAFVILSPTGLVALCLSIYKFGGELAPRWGERRLRRFALHVVLASAVGGCVLALLSSEAMYAGHSGSWALCDALAIAWARQYPRSQILIWGLVAVNGTRLITVVVGITAIFAIAYGPLVMAPELIACAVAALYPRDWLARF